MNKLLKSILLSLVLCSVIACNKKEDPTPIEDEPVCEVSISNILTNTPYQTPIYHFVSNQKGPRFAIVGGIHGDEVAGWNAAKQLIQRTNYKGEVLIIPYANIVGDVLKNRYPGINTNGIITSNQQSTLLTNKELKEFTSQEVSEIAATKFDDLNRTFASRSMTGTVTQRIAYEVLETVIAFEPDYVVDLHESRFDHKKSKGTTTYLGNLVIYGGSQSSNAAWEIVDEFNDKYLKDGEDEFDYYEGNVLGSHCNTLGKLLPNSRVFTIETNREFVGGVDTANLNRRIEQQIQLVDIMLNHSYEWYSSN